MRGEVGFSILTWRADLHLQIYVDILAIKANRTSSTLLYFLLLFLRIGGDSGIRALRLFAVCLRTDLALVGLTLRATILVVVESHLVIHAAACTFTTARCLTHLIYSVNIIILRNS